MTLTILCEEPASTIEFCVVTDRCKDIENFAVVRSRITNSIGGNYWQLQRVSDSNCSLISPFLFPLAMTLQFDIDIFPTEDMGQVFDCLASSIFSSVNECGS